MLSRTFRPVRAFRILLSCLVLWLAAPASATHEVWSDAVAIVVSDGPAAGALGETAREQGAPNAQNEGRRASPVRRERTSGAFQPREAAARRSSRDLYLRNCVLLC
jgi:hypothetical protein